MNKKDKLEELDFIEGDKFVPYLNSNKLPDVASEFVWSGPLGDKRVKELNKARKSIVQFAERFYYITTTDDGKQKIKLYPAQRRVLKSLEDNRFCAVLATRQVGKSTMMSIFALHMAIFSPDTRIVILANKENTAKNILRGIKRAYENLPNWLKGSVTQWDKTELIFGNGSSIATSTTTSSSSRGDTAKCVIIDEMGHIPSQMIDEFWLSVIPVVSASSTSKIFAVSTANGTANKFYSVYMQGVKKEAGWVSERIDWWEVPGRDEKWKATQIALLGSEASFEQEYGNSFDTARTGVLEPEIIDQMRREVEEPKYVMDDGNYKIWKEPQKGHIYVMGCDIGEGVGETASVINVIDITDLTRIEQVAIYRNNKINQYQLSKVIYEKAGQWGNPYLAMERNGPGNTTLSTLIEKYQYKKTINYLPSGAQDDERPGIYSHTNVKLEGVTNLRYWGNEIRCLKINDLQTLQELITFIKHPNGMWKKQNGNNIYDDCVTSLIWALFVLKTEIAERYYEIVEYDENGRPMKLNRGEYDADGEASGLSVFKGFDFGDVPEIDLYDETTGAEIAKYAAEGWIPL